MANFERRSGSPNQPPPPALLPLITRQQNLFDETCRTISAVTIVLNGLFTLVDSIRPIPHEVHRYALVLAFAFFKYVYAREEARFDGMGPQASRYPQIRSVFMDITRPACAVLILAIVDWVFGPFFEYTFICLLLSMVLVHWWEAYSIYQLAGELEQVELRESA